MLRRKIVTSNIPISNRSDFDIEMDSHDNNDDVNSTYTESVNCNNEKLSPFLKHIPSNWQQEKDFFCNATKLRLRYKLNVDYLKVIIQIMMNFVSHKDISQKLKLLIRL